MTEKERLEIINWLCSDFFSMYVNGLIALSNGTFSSKPGRVRLELSPLDSKVPNVIWRIKKRIIDREFLHDYEKEPMLNDLVTIMLPGGQIFPHKDSSIGEYIHSRFNVFLIQPPNDFTTFYGGKPVDAVEGHYTLCRSGLDTHWTDVLKNDIPRITLSFGFLIPRDILNKMYEAPLTKAIKHPSPKPHPFDVLEQIRKNAFWQSDRFGLKWWATGIYSKKINE